MLPRSILIINQPWSNHGDEAAHKALVRMLRSRFGDARIRVLAYVDMVPESELEIFRPDDVEGVEYIRVSEKPPYKRLEWASRFPPEIARRILLTNTRYAAAMRLMREADLIVSAPGGVDLGPYRNWLHLALLLLAVESGTPTAIYACSMGPMPHDDAADDRFSATTESVLGRLEFLSLREPKSQHYADEMGLAYVPTVDTAFLDASRRECPDELRRALGSAYIVLVPNQLHRWHPAFLDWEPELLDRLFSELISAALGRASQVVLMPHLFGFQNDSAYCDELASLVQGPDRDRILVLPEYLPVETLRSVIADAELLVGARSHSVIFALQAGTPFVSLAYEHKMHALLEQASLGQYMYSIEDRAKVDPAAAVRLFNDTYDHREEARAERAAVLPPLVAMAKHAADLFGERFSDSA